MDRSKRGKPHVQDGRGRQGQRNRESQMCGRSWQRSMQAVITSPRLLDGSNSWRRRRRLRWKSRAPRAVLEQLPGVPEPEPSLSDVTV